ncbi:MAG: thioredoxin [Lachnospiraceae bacterium]|nr:thioredoxin [Lachnospiraceae bacterium]
MAAIILNEGNFEQEVLNSSEPVLVDFWATWCGPCQKQGPIVEQLAEELTDVKVGKVDVDQASAIAERYNIMSIPTIMVFKNGQASAKAVGLQSKEALLDLIRQ